MFLACRNILLDENLRPKISDFGLSRFVEDETGGTTKTEVGPLMWMSPEQLSKKVYSEKSDVWSFGVTCWEIINQQVSKKINIKNNNKCSCDL